jgi:hypothetical protein
MGCGEQAGERRDGFEQQRVEASLLVGGIAGAELGDGAAVLGVRGNPLATRCSRAIASSASRRIRAH